MRGARLGFPAVADFDGKLAAACGVYSTPQAVVISIDGRLLFRGNYNASRYCASPATQFARLALEAAVNVQAIPEIPAVATIDGLTYAGMAAAFPYCFR